MFTKEVGCKKMGDLNLLNEHRSLCLTGLIIISRIIIIVIVMMMMIIIIIN